MTVYPAFNSLKGHIDSMQGLRGDIKSCQWSDNEGSLMFPAISNNVEFASGLRENAGTTGQSWSAFEPPTPYTGLTPLPFYVPSNAPP